MGKNLTGWKVDTSKVSDWWEVREINDEGKVMKIYKYNNEDDAKKWAEWLREIVSKESYCVCKMYKGSKLMQIVKRGLTKEQALEEANKFNEKWANGIINYQVKIC